MTKYNTETPVLLIIEGEYEVIIKLTYNLLRQLEPKRLCLFYNFPVSEAEKKSQEQMQTFFSEADWKCSIKSFYSSTHLEYSALMMQAVCWFFKQETEGIVLDGRSTPPPAFFAFCSYMLEKYRHDERIGHISGHDFRKPVQARKSKDMYYFSKLTHTEKGWASWRRVWKDVPAQLKSFHSFTKSNVIEDIPSHKPFQFVWSFLFRIEAKWDVKYEYVNVINNRLSIVMNSNKLKMNEYELPEMSQPRFMVNPLNDELDFQELKYQLPAITPNKPEAMRFLQEKLYSSQTTEGQRMKIPRIIHQIYEDPAGPTPDLLRIAESWKRNMPDWEYRFWNRSMIDDFLKTTCPDFEGCYRSYPFNVQRWDAIRYLILYHIGGLYVDFDYECLQPLDVLLVGTTCCMGMEPTINSRVYKKSIIVGNALMAAKPGHPYMAAIIDDMKANISTDYKKGDSMQIMETTGPFMVSRVYERLKKKKNVTLLPSELVAPLTMREVLMLRTGNMHPDVLKKMDNAYAIHYFFGSWSVQTEERQKQMET